jgi:5-methylcytosine-specific restriction endonuclease McrA
LDAGTRQLVRERAGDSCGYCQLPQSQFPLARLQIEHVIPRKHGGSDVLENLALACIDCNLHKGSNLSGIDPQTGLVVRLFNPRRDKWSEHFPWDGILITGTSDVGRTTIVVLDVNSEDRLMVRLS